MAQPPSYSLDFPTPDYSAEPGVDEERLEYREARWQEYNTRPTGVFIRERNGITVILNNQEEKTTVPTFGRRSKVEGTLVIDTPESVSEVTLKLTGAIETVALTAGWAQVKVLDQTHTIFKSDDSGASQSHCESSLQFSCPLPLNFEHDGQEYLLPPSYYALLGGQGQTQYAKCTYMFTAIISRTRSRHTAFLGKNKKNNTFMFEYLPRFRPPRPMINRSLLTTIKTHPEEWRQFSYQLTPKSEKHMEPLTCQFFLPSVGMFGVMDSIPFHVQIAGSHASLSRLQPLSSDSESLSSDLHRRRKADGEDSEPPIRVRLVRQVAINNNGHKNAVHLHLGDGKLCPLPPVEGPILLAGSRVQRQENVNWEGEIRCELEEKLTPGFNAGIVTIADFVIVELSKWQINLFQPFKHGHPVRLVSDSWTDFSR
ncbi:hypothetical protein BT96DRAFT_990587 [Gymnopus androsaceus JB14]|uniref:Arrestin-like N-terminal domain-containing protein n=1 Tax=Gymnopus androsaceus JB14 TaxID=1447944 RepID=A0A6A4HX96_9AGAR|nr:hypothetical protein BT96DRAFT_990587 [Gymnopus androsaceus JB14]